MIDELQRETRFAQTESAGRLGRLKVQPARVVGHDADSLQNRARRGPSLRLAGPWRGGPRAATIRLAIVIPVLLFVFSLYQNLSNMDTVDFHRDEARWINRASYLEELVHPFGDAWTDYYLTQGQPSLGNYLMGIGLLFQGRDLETNRVWDFRYDDAWNIQAGAMPERADLNAGRRTNAVMGALVVVCVYMLASRISNSFGGVMGAFFLSVHPLHIRLSSQALSDELLAFLLMAAFLMAWRFTRSPSFVNAALLATTLGLGGAAKLSPLLLTLPLAALGAVWLGHRLFTGGRNSLQWRRARFGWLLIAQPVMGFLVFVLANPYLWSDPIGRTMSLIDFRRAEMDGQSTAWPIAAVESPLVAFQRTGRRFDLDYSSSMRVQEWLGNVISFTWAWVSLDVIAMAAGVVILVALVVKRGVWSPTTVTACLMAASSATIILGMGVDFYRYFLPLLIVLAVCVGVAFGAAFDLIRKASGQMKLLRSPRTPQPNRGTIGAATRS